MPGVDNDDFDGGGRPRRRLLTARHRKAARLLADGLTQVRVAQIVGVSDRTIRNWRASLPRFQELEEQERRADPFGAGAVIEDLMRSSENESIRLRAAIAHLRHRVKAEKEQADAHRSVTLNVTLDEPESTETDVDARSSQSSLGGSLEPADLEKLDLTDTSAESTAEEFRAPLERQLLDDARAPDETGSQPSRENRDIGLVEIHDTEEAHPNSGTHESEGKLDHARAPASADTHAPRHANNKNIDLDEPAIPAIFLADVGDRKIDDVIREGSVSINGFVHITTRDGRTSNVLPQDVEGRLLKGWGVIRNTTAN